jgi:hypothetical protein
VLPFFRFMTNQNEGGTGFAIPPDTTVQPGFTILNDALPDFLLNESTVMEDLKDRALPWRQKTGWSATRSEKEVQVATLENDYLKVDVTPLWGGYGALLP